MTDFSSKTSRFFKVCWPSLIVGAGILYLSLIRAPHIHLDQMANQDKISHLFAYFVWAFFLTHEAWAFRLSSLKKYFWALVFPMLAGGLIEILQENFFKPRTGEWLDWYADCTGVALGFILVDVFFRFHRTNHA